ncbi:hypothetical protein TRICI_000422 [Trichomonascus ciferrii]|uniref:Isochorismatase-like domain-containing protein n=1 Tax=Trichomonascus ciferrii TaxID=44093 RepID=A0A642VDD6_9ASCO|nr:hypothetical protein TRICI_000422 [Trichomonascus ciferrii]
MHPELKNDSPFSKLTEPIGTFEIGTPEAQLASFFQIDAQDTVVDKTRFSGTTGSSLEQIIKAQNIDTVVIVIMSTVYHLLDLDYNIFVITDSVVELPTSHNTEFIKVMMDTLPKMSLKTISLDQALVALEKS